MLNPGLNSTAATETKLDTIATELSDGFNIPEYDYILLTYVPSGDGVGEIQTVTYKSGGSGGTTINVLTLGYDTDDNLSSVTKV